jgi:hypothetical protein
MDLLPNSLIPAAVRGLAKACQAEGLPIKALGSWRVFTEKALIDKSIRSSAVYSTDAVEVKHPADLKWIAAELLVQIRCQLQPGCKVGARRVECFVKQKSPVEVECEDYVQHGPMGDSMAFRRVGTITIYGSEYLPLSLKGHSVKRFPALRHSPLPGVSLCTEEVGFSIWHLIALGLFPADFLQEFLETARKQTTEQRRQDLGETMKELDEEYRSLIEEFPGYPYTWDELKAVTAYRSVLELCTLTRKPLFGWYDLDPKVHQLLPPDIKEFVGYTQKHLSPA